MDMSEKIADALNITSCSQAERALPKKQGFLCVVDDLDDMLYRLDNIQVICNKEDVYKEVYEEFNKFPLSNELHAKELFGFSNVMLTKKRNAFIEQCLICYRDMSRKARKYDLSFRLKAECLLREKQGWFFIFNTLTVDSRNLETVFGKNSSAWTDYVRMVDRVITRAAQPPLTLSQMEADTLP